MTVSLWPSRTYILLLWPLLFRDWCSGRLDMKMSTSQFFGVHAHIGHHRWIWCFPSCTTFQPCKMTFIHSYIIVIPHLCIFTTLHWCVTTWHIHLTFFRCHSITLCTPMHYHMHYIDCVRLGFKPCSSLYYYSIHPWIIQILIKYMFITFVAYLLYDIINYFLDFHLF